MPRPETTLEVESLVKHFPIRSGLLRRQTGNVQAVDGVSFSIKRGETLGLVGESGCGKSTVAKTVLRLIEPTGGKIVLDGVDLTSLSPAGMWQHRKQIQIVFQDPYSSLNPRLSAGTIVGEPMENYGVASGSEKRDKVAKLFERVGLRPEAMRKYPHEFSGGQRQRLGIARALSVEPDVIVADEPVSALDVSVQAQVLNLLIDLQDEFRLSYLFVSHDLGVVRHISHRVAVMYLGRIVELADKDELFNRPIHPYTEALLSAVPKVNPKIRRRRMIIEGDVPSPAKPPQGCRFHTRCPYVLQRCKEIDPPLTEILPGHFAACIRREPGIEPQPLTPTH